MFSLFKRLPKGDYLRVVVVLVGGEDEPSICVERGFEDAGHDPFEGRHPRRECLRWYGADLVELPFI